MQVPESLLPIRAAIAGTRWEGRVWLVGGAVRDTLLGSPVSDDFDLASTESAPDLARALWERGIALYPPAIYASFGTARVELPGATAELVTTRRESYRGTSRKPDVEPASIAEDAQRRDFTANALYLPLDGGAVMDPTGQGLADLEARVLRTPLDPERTFHEDPLRMLRAVRFRWRLGFSYAPGLAEAIRREASRLEIVSIERIRDEVLKILAGPNAEPALGELLDFGLLDEIAPEFRAMQGCTQGRYHDADVWDHTRRVVGNVGTGDAELALAALLHDVGKPPCRSVDADGNIRFFEHEVVGEEMARTILRRWRMPERTVGRVARLVRNHMRLGSAPEFSAAAARRLWRDLGEDVPALLDLVEADKAALRPGLVTLDLQGIRDRLQSVLRETPPETVKSPLDGLEIAEALGLAPGPEIGVWKQRLAERVVEGTLAPGDKEGARAWLLAERAR